jgi:hypothetical protein
MFMAETSLGKTCCMTTNSERLKVTENAMAGTGLIPPGSI